MTTLEKPFLSDSAIDISDRLSYTQTRMAKSKSSTTHLPILMRVARHERLHTIFIIHDLPKAPGQTSQREFRIFTKEKEAGTLELLGYQYEFDGHDEHQANVVRAPSVPQDKLLDIIRRLVEQTQTDVKQMEVIDLTPYPNSYDQADRLARHDLLEAFDFE